MLQYPFAGLIYAQATRTKTQTQAKRAFRQASEHDPKRVKRTLERHSRQKMPCVVFVAAAATIPKNSMGASEARDPPSLNTTRFAILSL